MTQEEKAKAYEERLDTARHIYADPSVKEEDKYYIEVIFPELKESEDERIRKRIIHALHGDVLEMSEIKEAVAWLEKQGELQLYKGNADTMRKNLIKAFKTVGTNHWGGLDVKDILYFLESKDAIELEKQGEQKQYDIDVLEKHITKDSISELAHTVIVRNGWEIVDAKEQNPAWSEEDEKEYKYVLKFVDNILNNCGNKKDYEHCKRCYDWLKSLKQKIGGKQ